MHPEDRDKLSKVEELKSRLYSKTFETKISHRDSFTHRENDAVPDSWVSDKNSQTTEKFFMQTSLFKKFFIFSVIFFLIATAYGSFVFFKGENTVSNNNIDISILGNAFTAGGEELPLQIGISNRNASALELVDLVVEYPKSSETLDFSKDIERLRVSLGTIPSGAVRNENVKVILFGEQGSVRPVRVSIEYRVEGSNAIFVKDKTYEVNINSTPINLTLEAPKEVSPNQDITLNIKSALNATRPAQAMLIKVDYPVGFQFVSSNPPPSYGNNVWSLGDLAPGAERSISLSGKMVDVFDGEEKTFKVWSGSQSKSDKSSIDVVFNSLGHTTLIQRPFIEARLYVAGVSSREYAVSGKSNINAEIRWTNNLDTRINDLEIRAKISGNALNERSISPQQGFYNSLEDVIVWDRNTISRFRDIPSGESGSVSFSFSTLALSEAGTTLSSPQVTIELSILGKQAISGYETKEVRNSNSTVIKLMSDVGFAVKSLYFSGPFKNTGPIPPKAEQATTYTVVWSLSNSANNISKGVVRATLPSWATFIGPIAPSSEDVYYNQSTKEITWTVGNIPRGTGTTNTAKEVAFRVSITPSLSQVGESPVIINDAVLTGHDDFANVDIRVSRPSLSTRLNNDSGAVDGSDRVVE